ncbi:MAG: NADH:ubiquinone oxidoreductase subunit J [Gammaproteobacteria bacterium SG8_31]|nr:MAG: NADH:ubiquinone oxidoreductase subunit J [Gammaproteobacteria bacterium SG8_31]
MIESTIFYVFGGLLLAAAVGVITSRNPVHSVLFLVLAFVTSAFLWMLLEAEFLAIVLVLVYVGAVMVLFLFVVMMLDVKVEQVRAGFTRYAPLGIGVVLLIVAQLGYVVWVRTQDMGFLSAPGRAPANYSNTEELGRLLYTDYVYPFELAAVILLVAIVAAISLTMRRRPGLKVQNVAKQVRVRREDRVRLVRMDAEKGE